MTSEVKYYAMDQMQNQRSKSNGADLGYLFTVTIGGLTLRWVFQNVPSVETLRGVSNRYDSLREGGTYELFWQALLTEFIERPLPELTGNTQAVTRGAMTNDTDIPVSWSLQKMFIENNFCD